MRRFGWTILGGLVGYLLGAFGGGLVITVASSNTHDLSLEAAMTGVFIIGPLVGLIGAAIGFTWAGRSAKPSAP